MSGWIQEEVGTERIELWATKTVMIFPDKFNIKSANKVNQTPKKSQKILSSDHHCNIGKGL
jgi:hypothetical protein